MVVGCCQQPEDHASGIRLYQLHSWPPREPHGAARLWDPVLGEGVEGASAQPVDEVRESGRPLDDPLV